MSYTFGRQIFWGFIIALAAMLAMTPTSAQAQGTTFGVDNNLCAWTNAPAAPDPTQCVPIASNQVIPGQPIFYRVTITGNANAWNVKLTESYEPGFASNVQDVRCVPKNATTPVFVASNPLAVTLGPFPIAAGQDVHCTIAGFFTAGAGITTSAKNEVTLEAAGSAGTGSGGKIVNATVLTTATLPTDLSITKTRTSPQAIALGGTVTFALTISNAAAPPAGNGQPVYLGAFLQVFDRLAKLPGSMDLMAKLTGPPTCTAQGGGASCLDPAPFPNPNPPQLTVSQTSTSPTNNWNPLAKWHYATGNSGFLPAGGSMTLTYTLQITGPGCGNTTGHGFRNFATFDLLGQMGTTVTESGPGPNSTDPSIDDSLVTITGAFQPCTGTGNSSGTDPAVTVTKKVVPTPSGSTPWNSSVTYEVTVTNNTGAPLTNINLYDQVSSNFPDVPMIAQVLANPTCVPACGGATKGPKVIGNAAIVWQSSNIASLPATPGLNTITFPITIKYDMNSCAAQPRPNWSITNLILVTFSTPSGSKVATAAVQMAQPPLCEFLVDKKFNGGSAPATLLFNTPYDYDVTFKNQSMSARTIYTLRDSLRIDTMGYATSMALAYRYSCTSPSVPPVTGFTPAQSAGYPALIGGPADKVVYTTNPVNGTPLISMVGNAITFPGGGVLTCAVRVVVQRPMTGDPNCMASGAAGLQNAAMLFPGAAYNVNAGAPASGLWSERTARLPRCFSLPVNKEASPKAALGTGPPLAYTVTVTNNGDDAISGLSSPNWLTLTDVFAGAYAPGAATVTVTNPAGACGPAATANCELITASGSPIALGIKNLAKGQKIVLTYPLAPPFTTEKVRNDVTIATNGTLTTDWYPREDTLTSYNEVPITNPGTPSAGSAMLKVCKVAGEGVDVGTPFDFAATAAGTTVSATVPAGPGPGGYCQIVGRYAPGTRVILSETGPRGYDVTAIAVTGSPTMPAPGVDRAGGKVDLMLGTGVTEATFTNFRGTGYAEICKAGDVRGMFHFSLDGRPLAVPAGACSPAIELKAGSHRLEERAAPGTAMQGCQIWPADRKYTCQPGTRSMTFEVKAGSVAMQTIVTVVNRKSDNGIPDTTAPAQ